MAIAQWQSLLEVLQERLPLSDGRLFRYFEAELRIVHETLQIKPVFVRKLDHT